MIRPPRPISRIIWLPWLRYARRPRKRRSKNPPDASQLGCQLKRGGAARPPLRSVSWSRYGFVSQFARGELHADQPEDQGSHLQRLDRRRAMPAGDAGHERPEYLAEGL